MLRKRCDIGVVEKVVRLNIVVRRTKSTLDVNTGTDVPERSGQRRGRNLSSPVKEFSRYH